MEKIRKNALNVVVSLVLGGAILYWMYRDFDFERVRDVLTSEMSWTWMLLSFPFGIMAQVFRGWRWRQSLEPLGERSRASVRIHAVFLSYAASLLIPRSGEFLRCGKIAQLLGEVTQGKTSDEASKLAIKAIRILSQDVGIPAGLIELGKRYGVEVKAEDIPTMTANAQKDACGLTNPRKMTDKAVADIYTAAL